MNELGCKSCGSTDTISRDYVDNFFSRTRLFENQIVVCCMQCGFGYSLPKLEENVIYEFYKNIYRSQDSPYYINFDQLTPHGIDRAIAQLQLAFDFLGEKKTGELKFLDIGPGDGSSFIAIQDKNILSSYAIELSKDSADAYRKLFNVSTAETIEQVPSNLLFDIVLSSHCFEHFYIEDLKVYLLKLKCLISSGGVIVVEVPNDDFRIFKKYSDSPHFTFFSKESLQRLFTECGYEIIFCETCGHKIKDYDEIANQSSNLRNRLKSTIVNIVSKSAFGRRGIIFLKRKMIKTKLMLDPKALIEEFNTKTYEYGGDRICIRILAKPF
jgi:2-polyprenyl-3-methyl-5-hydroxy-6-metoxy-1,4-benzoquinol methylase